MNVKNLRISYRSNQRGATLVIALIFLLLIMMIGIVAMNSSNTQYRLAGNLQFENTAMNNAEAALAAGEQFLASAGSFKNPGFTTYSTTTPQLHPIGHLSALAAPADNPLTMAWNGTSDKQVDSSNQRYMVEQMSAKTRLLGSSQAVGGHRATACNEVNTYRVTGKGQAPRGGTKFVQSFYSVLSCP